MKRLFIYHERQECESEESDKTVKRSRIKIF